MSAALRRQAPNCFLPALPLTLLAVPLCCATPQQPQCKASLDGAAAGSQAAETAKTLISGCRAILRASKLVHLL